MFHPISWEQVVTFRATAAEGRDRTLFLGLQTSPVSVPPHPDIPTTAVTTTTIGDREDCGTKASVRYFVSKATHSYLISFMKEGHSFVSGRIFPTEKMYIVNVQSVMMYSGVLKKCMRG